jgi:phytoene synthase
MGGIVALAGNAQRLNKEKYTSFTTRTYMYGSAEVGKMMSVLLDREAIEAAALQGKAMQYVNFIRDVKEDIALGRNYLGYSESLLHDPQAWATFLRTQIEHYQKLQQQAEKGYRFIPKKYLIPIKTASDMYAWTAQEIYNNPHIVLERKIKPRRVRVVYHY